MSNDNAKLAEGIAGIKAAVANLEAALGRTPQSRTAAPGMRRIFRHYKSTPGRIEGMYEILFDGKLTGVDTFPHPVGPADRSGDVDVVVYRSLADDRVWVRPSAEFYGDVMLNGTLVERFRSIEHDAAVRRSTPTQPARPYPTDESV